MLAPESIGKSARRVNVARKQIAYCISAYFSVIANPQKRVHAVFLNEIELNLICKVEQNYYMVESGAL